MSQTGGAAPSTRYAHQDQAGRRGPAGPDRCPRRRLGQFAGPSRRAGG